MPRPYRDDEIPDNYMDLRDRVYDRQPQMQLPSLGGFTRNVRSRAGRAVDDVSRGVHDRAKALRRVLAHLLSGR